MPVNTFTIAATGDDKNAILTFIWNDGGGGSNLHAIGNLGGQPGYHSWLRFQVNIAQGTTLTSAYLKLNNNGTGNGAAGGGVAKLKVHCEDVDNSTMPADASAADARTLTAGVALTPAYTTGVYSLDITSEVQTVINRAGWVANNYLSVFAKDDGAVGNQYLFHRDYGAGSSVAAQLEITTPSSGRSIPLRPSQFKSIVVRGNLA